MTIVVGFRNYLFCALLWWGNSLRGGCEACVGSLVNWDRPYSFWLAVCQWLRPSCHASSYIDSLLLPGIRCLNSPELFGYLYCISSMAKALNS